MTTLRELKEGEKGIITKVRGRGAFRRRIMEMGFVKGKEVTVIKSAPLKDPVEYRLMNYEVSLRRSEAALIEVVTSDDSIKEDKTGLFNGILLSNGLRKKVREKEKTIDIALVGNPNSGKTTLFNLVSKSREHVGNYGGVTVDAKMARFKMDGYTFNITDLPGTYSLTDYSPEELYVRKHIFSEIPDIVVNVIDASNLERNLFLTTQLIDMDIRVVIALNMYDELEKKGDDFDFVSLGKMLGIPIIPTISNKSKGYRELFRKVIQVYEDQDPDVRHIHINYGFDMENSLRKIQDALWKSHAFTDRVSSRYYAIKLLEEDKSTNFSLSKFENYPEINSIVKNEIRKLEQQYNEETSTLIADAKYGFISGALKETYTPNKQEIKTREQRFDRFLTSKWLSYPIFLFFMWLMFETTFIVGQYPMDWIESFVGFLGAFISANLADGVVKDLLVDGIVGGVGGVIVFLPNILILFLFISLMEDTGYMARVAFILDKLMHNIGLHGKSFIPLLMGFGCNVPAILATRTIESRNDRLVTMLINPFMSCSARYPVYILLISAFFEKQQGLILFGIYLFGIAMAAFMALVFKRTMFRAKEMPFVMELPPYRMPTLKTTIRHTWFRGEQYLKKMGGVILFASIIIWALGYFPRNNSLRESYDNQVTEVRNYYESQIGKSQQYSYLGLDLSVEMNQKIDSIMSEKVSRLQESSFIGRIGKALDPVLSPLGFNWKMNVSLVAGIAAKEVVVSTLGVLYHEDTGN
ncbi:MAG: ferrous iron transport protein B, partial [Bacteroidetes bacterium]|nr:ferrous iron transport protein B [Bacteroidota bacterium]